MYVFFNLASNTIAKVVGVERAEILRASATQGKCAFGAIKVSRHDAHDSGEGNSENPMKVDSE